MVLQNYEQSPINHKNQGILHAKISILVQSIAQLLTNYSLPVQTNSPTNASIVKSGFTTSKNGISKNLNNLEKVY